MDVFSRTFLPATAEAGLPIPVVSRHMPVLRRCVPPEETTLLATRCRRPGVPAGGGFLLLLTNRRLVVTHEGRLLHRVQLHLDALLKDLSEVGWTTHLRSGIELAATAADGVRERFWIPVPDPRRVWHLDALFSHGFRSRTVATGTGTGGPAPRAAFRLAPARAG